jgi:hypothetical protein
MRRLALAAALVPALLAALALADPVPPQGAAPLAPEAALACAAARYRSKALRIDAREGDLVQDIRWRTPAGNVIEIRLSGPGCLFLDVRGVGQAEARILPGETP